MHIMEGYLPMKHAAAWWAVSLPFMAFGVRSLERTIKQHPSARLPLAACGAFVFVLSALKLPSVTGSCSHPTGTGLGAMLFGPTVMTVLGSIVLLLQALLLAHGGLTTLGANAFSMAIVGPFLAWATHRLLQRVGSSQTIAVFSAAALGNLMTYVCTAFQLALAFPDPVSGFAGALVKFMVIFALTQIPLAITEGILTVIVMKAVSTGDRKELRAITSLSNERRKA